MTVCEVLAQRFKESRDDILFIAPERRTLSYGQALTNACRLALEWTNQGACKGDAVAINLTNDLSVPCCYLACLLAGFVAVPINPELGEENVRFILNLVAPAVAVTSPPAVDYDCLPTAEIEFAGNPDGCGAIFFTSGTTGRPKGVRHSWSALVGNVLAFNRFMEIARSTRMYHVLPMTYMAGFLNTILSPLVAGGAVITGPRFSPETALDFWSWPVREEANTMWVTPSIAAALARLVRDRGMAHSVASAFKTILCGTAPLNPSVRRTFSEQFGAPLQESYGTSELLLVSAQSRSRAELMSTDVGPILPELEINFREDEEGREELFIRSPFSMLGYLTEEGLVPVNDSNGFVPTGDVGRLDDGILQITGRIKDLVIRGGVNISPRSVENVLGDLPGVEDVAVVGVPHEFWGEKLVACIQASAGIDRRAVEVAVRQRCRERLARSHQPDDIAILSKFPRSVTGKVQKHILQRTLAT
jgi:acyl-CoA synthetase (AMP-forming)/AMP-acid ligase II